MRLRMLAVAFLAAASLSDARSVAAAELTETAMASCEATMSVEADDVMATAFPLADKPGPQPDALCNVTCDNGTVLECNVAGCNPQPPNCPNSSGYIVCGSTTKRCPKCPGCVSGPTCTSATQCTNYCGGPAICNGGCCFCI